MTDKQPAACPMKFRKTALIEAVQWRKNGDHPADYANPVEGLENDQLRTWTGEEAKALGWEGQIVRYFRRPDVPGDSECGHCGNIMHIHGWIDTLEGGHIVCPGDWIATGVQGEHWPIKPDIFAATYEPADTRPATAQGDVEVALAVWQEACLTWHEAPGAWEEGDKAAALVIEHAMTERDRALREAVKQFVHDFEGDFCIEGAIVDDPDPMLKQHYLIFRAILASTGDAA